MSKILNRFELNIDGSDYDREALQSIAISLKRIADSLEQPKVEFEMPKMSDENLQKLKDIWLNGNDKIKYPF